MLEPEAARAFVAENVEMQVHLVQMESNDEPDTQIEWALDEDVQHRNRLGEVDTWNTFKAYERVTVEPSMKVLSLVWVDKPEKSRLCVRGYERKLYQLYTPPPFPASMQVLLVVAWVESLSVRRFDVRRALSTRRRRSRPL